VSKDLRFHGWIPQQTPDSSHRDETPRYPDARHQPAHNFFARQPALSRLMSERVSSIGTRHLPLEPEPRTGRDHLMRYLSVSIILLAASVTLSANAQHGGAHGGGFSHSGGASGHFSAPSSGFHSAPAPHISSGFRGGFNAPPSRFNGSSSSPRPYRPGMPANLHSPGYRSSYSTRPAYPIQGQGSDRFRQPYRGSGGNRDHDGYHRHRYGFAYWNTPYAIPFLYPYNGWLDSGYYDDNNGSYDNYVTSQPYQGADFAQDDSNDGPPYPQDDDQLYQNAYPSQPNYPRPDYASPSAPPSQASVTLVFKDGRPSEQIHNYMLSRNTLTVLDQGRHDIPVDQLDLPATEKANRETGVDFHLPAVD
jgi:hypothetical protein